MKAVASNQRLQVSLLVLGMVLTVAASALSYAITYTMTHDWMRYPYTEPTVLGMDLTTADTLIVAGDYLSTLFIIAAVALNCYSRSQGQNAGRTAWPVLGAALVVVSAGILVLPRLDTFPDVFDSGNITTMLINVLDIIFVIIAAVEVSVGVWRRNWVLSVVGAALGALAFPEFGLAALLILFFHRDEFLAAPRTEPKMPEAPTNAQGPI